ncbi:unnamed protein product, partial [Scytosiphon promiscuus]
MVFVMPGHQTVCSYQTRLTLQRDVGVAQYFRWKGCQAGYGRPRHRWRRWREPWELQGIVRKMPVAAGWLPFVRTLSHHPVPRPGVCRRVRCMLVLSSWGKHRVLARACMRPGDSRNRLQLALSLGSGCGVATGIRPTWANTFETLLQSFIPGRTCSSS